MFSLGLPTICMSYVSYFGSHFYDRIKISTEGGNRYQKSGAGMNCFCEENNYIIRL